METRPQAGSESRTARVAAGTRPRRLRFPAGVVVLASILFLPGQIYAQDRPPARSPERYTTTKTWIPSDPRAINDDGVVVGDSLVFYKGTTVQLLGPFGDGGNSALVAVNNRGQVLLVQIYNGAHYFVYDPIRKGLNPIGLNGKVSEGGTIRTVHLVYLTGLDDEGRVYGIYGTPRGPCAVVGTPTTGNPGDKDPPPGVLATFTLIGCPGGGDLVIRGVNSKGQITGSVKQQGFIWSDGKLSLFSFPGSNSTEGDAINDSGVVAASRPASGSLRWASPTTECSSGSCTYPTNPRSISPASTIGGKSSPTTMPVALSWTATIFPSRIWRQPPRS
jgi:hypothetical protein